jgi:hypothetical protein
MGWTNKWSSQLFDPADLVLKTSCSICFEDFSFDDFDIENIYIWARYGEADIEKGSENYLASASFIFKVSHKKCPEIEEKEKGENNE